jgi:hypothetical protein
MASSSNSLPAASRSTGRNKQLVLAWWDDLISLGSDDLISSGSTWQEELLVDVDVAFTSTLCGSLGESLVDAIVVAATLASLSYYPRGGFLIEVKDCLVDAKVVTNPSSFLSGCPIR